MPDYTVKADVDTMLRAANNAAIRSAIGVGQTDAPTFLSVNVGSSTTSLSQLSIVGQAASNTLYLSAPNYIALNSDQISLMNASVRSGLWGRTTGITVLSGHYFGFSSSATDAGFPAATILARDADGILAQRNGTAKQTLRIYNTYTSANIYERAVMDWNGPTPGNLQIGTEFLGSGSGMAARPIDFVTGGVVRMSIGADGGVSVAANLNVNDFVSTTDVSAGVYIMWGGGARSRMTSPSSGLITLYNSGATDFGRLQLGGTTSAFPAIKRNGAQIDIRLADDSSYTTINASDFTGYNGGVAKMYAGGAGVFQAVSTGYFALSSSATNVFAGDTYLSRSAPGVWQMGTSSSNATADLRLRSVIQQPPATITPANNGDLVVEATSNTLLTFKYKGSDGTVRSGTLAVV